MKRWLAGVLLLLACSEGTPPRERAAGVRVVVRPKPGAALGLAGATVEPTAAVRRLRVAADQLEVEVTPGTPSLSVRAPGACPLEIATGDAAAGDARVAELVPWFSVASGELAQVGFDTPFTVTLVPGCREALTRKVEWTQTAGEPIAFTVEQNGLVVRGRTRPLAAPVPWGIVPLSPRTRGEVELTARSGTLTLGVRLAAAARASGLPSLALAQRVLLGGHGWRVRERARGGTADVRAVGPLNTFQPDARGRWVLEDGEGRELSVVVGTHSETLLDCGRSDCHPSATQAARSSPMTRIFARGLRGELVGYDPICAVPCHTTGEPGLPDGGFVQVRDELGLGGRFETGPQAWDELPRPLRRLGGVTCTACHGPGAVPEPAARWAVLRSDVCATCHDAPPRYGHVVAWNGTRMARADRDARARREPACRGCHTTAGFLARLGVRKDGVEPDLELGIGCAACHAPHAPRHERALLRELPDEKLPDPARPSRICVECHAGPDASAATLLYGHDAPGAHAGVPKGCIGCHSGPSGDAETRGNSHAFSVDRARCTRGCHADGLPDPDPKLAERARAALRALGGRLEPGRPFHAVTPPRPVEPKRREALALLRTVLGDGAAAVHDARRARALLDRVEELLGGRLRP